MQQKSKCNWKEIKRLWWWTHFAFSFWKALGDTAREDAADADADAHPQHVPAVTWLPVCPIDLSFALKKTLKILSYTSAANPRTTKVPFVYTATYLIILLFCIQKNIPIWQQRSQRGFTHNPFRAVFQYDQLKNKTTKQKHYIYK